jgi:hypothetical protein
MMFLARSRVTNSVSLTLTREQWREVVEELKRNGVEA